MIAPEKLPATCWACQHNYRSAVLMSPEINEGWCMRDRRSMPDPKRNPPPKWCRLRKAVAK